MLQMHKYLSDIINTGCLNHAAILQVAGAARWTAARSANVAATYDEITTPKNPLQNPMCLLVAGVGNTRSRAAGG